MTSYRTAGISSALAVALLMTAPLPDAVAGMQAGTGLEGSPHDIARKMQEPEKYERLCAFCHTPHHSTENTGVDYLPLWAHKLTEQTYGTYGSKTFDGKIADVIQGPTRLCMSCHDGIIAADQHYDDPGGDYTNTGNEFGERAIGKGGALHRMHPIGFDYTEAAKLDRGIRPETSAFRENPTGVTIQNTLYQGRIMTCATCHDVHNRDNVSSSNYNYFLYAPLKGSAICLSCHDK